MTATGRDWTASWVWPAGRAAANSYTYFRAEFELADRTGHQLHLSADSRYRLWVNGSLVGDGPPPSVPRMVYYDTHELDPHLRTGLNCVAVVVRYTGADHFGDELAHRPGLLAECDGPNGVYLATGSGVWRCRRALSWMPKTFQIPLNRFDPYQEVFDARREPEGWRDAGFVDSSHPEAWAAPEVVAEVTMRPDSQDRWAMVVPRPIPSPVEAHQRPRQVVAVDECLWLANRFRPDLSIQLSQAGRDLQAARADHVERFVTGHGPVTLACSDTARRGHGVDGVHDPCVLLDLGRSLNAYVAFDVEGPAGAAIDVGVAERLVDGSFNNALEGQFATRYILRDGRQRWRSSAWRGFRFLRLRLTEATAPVTVHDLQVVATRYPFEERGAFSSEDPRLDAIFDMCRHTISLCCHESIMDTPWREQTQWLGDAAAVTVGGIYACFGDTALAEKFLRQAAATQGEAGTLANGSNTATPPTDRDQDIPDYSLWWVIALVEHYRFTGDARLVHDLFGVTRKLLDAILARRTESGLVESFGWVFIDWADVDRTGECAALNAIAHGALRAGVELATVAGAGADAERWTAAADALRSAFRPRFWDESRGVLVDAVHEDGSRSSKVSEHANYAAIRFGLLSNDDGDAVVHRLLVEEAVHATEAQPFFTAVVLDALHRLGRTDLALQVIRDRWGRRMVDRGATSCYEEWGINGSWRTGSYVGLMRSLSHAWSAHPAAFLIRHLAGIEIIEPGCRRVRVAPPTVGLDLRAVFPTPLGPIRVAVVGDEVDVDAPDSVSIDVR